MKHGIVNHKLSFLMTMKSYTIILFLLISFTGFAQNKIPIIKANSKKALIVEGKDERYNWSISPQTKLDIHTISKTLKPKWITFYTDVDSIKINLKPDAHFDFMVLLNNKDTCYTRLESLPIKNYSRQKPVAHDTIPFILTEYNNIKIKAVLNTIDTLYLKFDSGTTGLLLTNDAIKHKTHLTSTNKRNNRLKISNLIWDSLQVYPVELSGQGTDGRFGWDLFDGKVIEIDYDRNLFIVHTKAPKISKSYSKLAIDYTNTLFCIRGELQIKDKKYMNRFLFDNGYQRTIMLDKDLVAEQNYPKDLKIIKKVIMRNGQGKEIPVLTVNNDQLNFGQHALRNIPVQLLASDNPAHFKTHIVGNEVLKRFNTFLDFQNNFVYLKPNSLFNLPYTDAM